MCMLFVGMGLQAQKNSGKEKEVLIDYGPKNFDINDDVRRQIDEAVGALLPGESVRFQFLTEADLKKEDHHQINIAQKRGEQALQYIHGMRYHGCWTEVISVTGKKRSAQKVGSNADYRSYAKTAGKIELQVFKDIYWKPMFYIDPAATGQKPCQEYSINAKHGDLIQGTEGTILMFEPDAFFLEDGCERVKICLQEYYSKEDMVAAGLTTIAGSKLLISEGMIYVKAVSECTGNEVRLKKEVTIAMPADKGDKKTDLFLGKREDFIVNWREKENETFELKKEGTYIGPPQTEVNENEEEMEYFEGLDLEKAAFVFKTKKLEWINTDRYYEIEKPVHLIVDSKELNSQTTVLVVVNQEKSIIPGYLYAGEKTAMFNPLPPATDVTVIAIRKAGAGYEVSYIGTNTSAQKVILPTFQQMDETLMQASLTGLLQP